MLADEEPGKKKKKKKKPRKSTGPLTKEERRELYDELNEAS